MKNPVIHWHADERAPIVELDREIWAARAVKELASREKDYYWSECGDSLVVAFRVGDDIEIFDCQIRRTAALNAFTLEPRPYW